MILAKEKIEHIWGMGTGNFGNRVVREDSHEKVTFEKDLEAVRACQSAS